MKKLFTAGLVTLLAASLLLGCGKTGAGAAAAPVSVESKKIALDKTGLTINLEIPVIKGMTDTNLQELLNRGFQQEAEEQQAWINKYRSEDTYSDMPYSLDSGYSVTCNSGGILSIVSEYYSYTGGAHGSTIRSSVNIDLNSGTRMLLPDFYNGSSPDDSIAGSIMSKVNEEPDLYFGDFAPVNSNPSLLPFFINEQGQPVVYFQQYEIAPYAAGILEFPLAADKTAFLTRGSGKIGNYYIENKTLPEDAACFGNYPQISGLADKSLQDSINSKLKTTLDNFVLRCIKEQGSDCMVDYRTASQDDHYLSILFFSSLFLSDTESSGLLQGATYDMKNGNQISAASIFPASEKDQLNTRLQEAAAAAKLSFTPALGEESGSYLQGDKVIFYYTGKTDKTIRLAIPLQ